MIPHICERHEAGFGGAMRSFASLCFGLVVAPLIAAACDGDPTSAGPDAGEADSHEDAAQGIGYGCCPLVGPPTCASQGTSPGGTKVAATNGCVGSYDAVVDPSAPGWSIRDDANGCPTWTPPAGARLIYCNGFDSGANDFDASDAAPE